MKKTFLLLIAFVSVMTFSSCKKDYSCTAVSPSGDESVFKCENCSKKDVESYEQSILDTGYTSASCEKCKLINDCHGICNDIRGDFL